MRALFLWKTSYPRPHSFRYTELWFQLLRGSGNAGFGRMAPPYDDGFWKSLPFSLVMITRVFFLFLNSQYFGFCAPRICALFAPFPHLFYYSVVVLYTLEKKKSPGPQRFLLLDQKSELSSPSNSGYPPEERSHSVFIYFSQQKTPSRGNPPVPSQPSPCVYERRDEMPSRVRRVFPFFAQR